MKFWFHSVFNGIILIVIGAVIWLSNLGIIHITWYRDWPVILIALGIIGVIKYFIKK